MATLTTPAAREPLTLEKLRRGPAVLRLWPDVGELLTLSRKATYRAAQNGDIPTIHVGARVVVPVPALLRMLGDLEAPEAS